MRDKKQQMFTIEGLVTIITGAASGIGREIACLFSDHGARIVAVDLDDEKLQEVVGIINGKGKQCMAVHCDVTSPEEVQAVVEKTVAAFGGIDVLVNNAGISPLKPLEEISFEEWNKVLAINLSGPFLFCQAALPYLKRSGDRARVINMGSLAGQMGGIAVGLHYTASKGGVIALSRQIAKLLAPTGGTSNCISPGTTETPLTLAWPEETRKTLMSQIPLGRLGTPQDIASLALFLASKEAGFITGATVNINGGLYIS